MKLQSTLRVFRAACLSAAAILSIAANSSAATPRWVQVTPFGGPIAALVQAPSAPRVLYAAAQNGRVFRSLDGGATWHRRKGGTGDDLIADLVVDPGDPRTVYARTGGFSFLLRTRDGGLTWSRIAPELQQVFALAADRNHPGVLFAATWNGLYRSADGGDSWSPALAIPGADAVAVDPRATDTVFAVVDEDRIPPMAWKSTDGGTTWTSAALPVTADFPGYPRFAFDPVRPEVLYLFFTGEYSNLLPVLRSTDGGASWSELPAAVGLRDLAVAPNDTLFGATDNTGSRPSTRAVRGRSTGSTRTARPPSRS